MTSVPAVLKSVAPFLKHAQQLVAHDPIVAYCCRLYAMQRGVALRSGANGPAEVDACKRFLLSQMDILEREKSALPAESATNDAMQDHLQRFAFRVFLLADDEDRAGKATKNTAKNFLSAAQFLEALSQFDELPEEITDKIKYAKWKAADISSCLNKGIAPAPGPPGFVPDQEGSKAAMEWDMEINSGTATQNVAPGGFDFPSIPGQHSNINSNSFSNQVDPGGPPSPFTDFSFPEVPSLGQRSQQQAQQHIPQQPQQYDFPSIPSFPSTSSSTPSSSFPNFPAIPSMPTQSDPYGFPSIPSTGSGGGGYDYLNAFPSIPSINSSQQPSQQPMGGVPSLPSFPSISTSSAPAPQDFDFGAAFPAIPSPGTKHVPNPGSNNSNTTPPSSFQPYPSAPNPASSRPAATSQQPNVKIHVNSAPSTPAISTNRADSRAPSTEDIAQAAKCAKFAASALQFDDVAYAVQNLEKALLLLTGRTV